LANKLSARFIDIGARKVKNIPAPVHAYVVATWDDGRSYGAPQATGIPASAKAAKGWLSVTLIGVIALCAVASAFLLATQRPDGKASLSTNAAAAFPPVPTSPPPASSPPPTSLSPAPAIRRTSSVKNEAEVTKRSFQSCKDLAAQRGWGSTESLGKTAFITACMKGDLD
jgi:hypothetical protein